MHHQVAKARLLLINTGGTISMVPGLSGFEPKRSVAEDLARTIVHDAALGIELDILSFQPLIDSADIAPADWNGLIDIIADAHRTHDGIVITHGTDTLAYTSAALTFALDGVERPVIVTGAMRPAGGTGSDAVDNLTAALKAANGGPPGVWVQFAGRLMAGDRVVKVSSIDLDAFREIPLPHPPAPKTRSTEFHARHFSAARICVFTLSPGLSIEAFDSALAYLDGVVLRCFGSGTIPSNPSFQEALSSRIEKGLTVLAVSQCEHGGVRPGEYSASSALRRLGVLDGGALTTEAAVAQLLLMLSDSVRDDQD